jgi:hypothetical protein
MVGALWLCIDYVLMLILLVLDSLQQLVFNLSELHTALVFTNLVTKSDHHWSVVVIVTVLAFIILFINLVFFTSVWFLGHDNLANELLIPLLVSLRHISLSEDRILIDQSLEGLLADELLQLVLDVHQSLADLLLLPLLLVLARG